MSIFTRWVPTLCLLGLLAVAGAGCTAGLKASYHQKHADQYYAEGKYDQAEIEYKNVLKHAPQNADAWAHLGLMYYDDGRVRDSFQTLSRAAQLSTNNLPVRLKLGAIYLDQGKFKEAKDEAEFVLARDPRDPQAPILLAGTAISTNEIIEVRQRLQTLAKKENAAALQVALGRLAFHQRDLKTAEANFREAAKLDPKFSDTYSALGNLYVARKDFTNAEAAFKQAMELAPPRAGKALLYAQLKILSGNPEAGKTVLQDLVKQAPDYLPAWLALAQLAAAQQDFSGGIKLLANVLNRDPGNLEALLLKARLEREQGKFAVAIQDFESIVKNFPNVPSVYYQLAQAQTDINDFDKAISNFNQALQLDPNYSDAILLLARIQMFQGNIDPAVASLQQLILQQPGFVPARLLLARAFRMRDRLDSAVQIYRVLQQAFPQNPEMFLLLGQTYLEDKKFTEARKQFEAALKLEPNYLPAVELLVNLDLRDKQFAAAGQRVQQQLNQNPTNAPLQLLQAQVQAVSGDTNQARSTLQKTIAANPGYIPAYLVLAQMLAAAKENQKALSELSAALAKDPQDTGALLLIGMTYDAEKDFDRARDNYEKLLTVDPDNVIALNNLAYLYSENYGDPAKGERLARRARELAPSDPSAADTLGWILFKQGQYSSALALLKESVARQDTNPGTTFHLGVAYYQTGDEANARTSFRRALQLNPDFPEHDECDQCLKVLAIDPKTADNDTKSWLEKRVRSRPSDGVAQLRLAEIYQREGKMNQAIDAYEVALKYSPRNIPMTMKLVELYASKDPQKALSLAKTAYQSAPNDPLVSHTLGRLAFLTGDYPWSVNLLQLAARNLSKDPEVLYDLGEAFYSVGRVADARSSMSNALQVASSFARTEDARRFLTLTALASNPSEVPAVLALADSILTTNANFVPALMVQGTIAQQKQDSATAQQAYEKVLIQYPDFSPAQKQLLLLYVKDSKNDTRAGSLAAKVRQTSPDDPEIAKAFGIIVYRRGDYNRAAGLLAEAAQKLNRDAELMYFQGMTQFQLKNRDKCKADLQSSLDLGLSGSQAADAKKILAELK